MPMTAVAPVMAVELRVVIPFRFITTARPALIDRRAQFRARM
jgi:hypothetical protein